MSRTEHSMKHEEQSIIQKDRQMSRQYSNLNLFNTSFSFFIPLAFGISLLIITILSIATPKRVENNKLPNESRMEYTDLHYKGAEAYLEWNGIKEKIDESEINSCYSDKLYAALMTHVPVSTKVLIPLVDVQIYQIPSKTLIALKDRCVIFYKATESVVYAWDPETETTKKYSFSSFEKNYRTGYYKAYLITDRGYKGDV